MKSSLLVEEIEIEELFIQYINILYNSIPFIVYEGLLFIFCIGIVLIFVLFGIKNSIKKIVGLIAVIYILFIFCSTVFFRPYSEFNDHELIPFWSYKAILAGRIDLFVEIVLNILVFVPIGFLISFLSHHLKWWAVLLIGWAISLSIELLQFIYCRGSLEIDDVFHNTLGCVIGIMMVTVLKRIWKFVSY